MRADHGSYFVTTYMETETTRGNETKKRKEIKYKRKEKDKNEKFSKLYAS